jgi:hypothetical protein
MMRQKFTNICVLQSFLLLANKLIFLFLISTKVYADWTKAEGRYFISRNISKGEACDRALMLAKRNALSKNGFQKFKSDQLDICTEIKDKTDCTFYQSTFDYVEGGFIKEFNYKETINKDSIEDECVININANVEQYNQKADSNYALSVRLENKKILYSNDNIQISGEVNKKSFITVLGWYPDIKKNVYYKLYPNESDKNNFTKNKFSIPNSDYKLKVNFPNNFYKNITQEFIVIIASKVKIDILEEENIIELYKRLQNLGRSQWQMQRLGYSIVRD